MTDRIIDILHGILFAGFFVGGVFFSFARRNQDIPKMLNRILGAKLLFLALLVALWTFSSFFVPLDNFAAETHTVVAYYLLTVPFCGFLLILLTRESKLTNKIISWQLGIPVTLVLLYTAQWFFQIPGCDLTFWIYAAYISVYSLYYILRCLLAYRRYEDTIRDIYADINGRSIDWLGAVLFLYLLLGLSFFVLKMVFPNDLSTIIFSTFIILFYLFFCHLIGRMRDVTLVETYDDVEYQESGNDCTLKKDDDTTFIDNLRDIIISQKLYANTDLNRNDVARVVGTNHLYLTRDIKRITGLTFMQYIGDIRLSIAEDLLSDPAMSLDDICAACGYNSQGTLYRSFIQKHGQSPSAYRRAHSNMQHNHANLK